MRLQQIMIGSPTKYRLEAMYGTLDDWGHLGLKQMFDIFQNQFYWQNLQDEATCHIRVCEHCLKFKGRPDKEELYQLLAMYPLVLVHMTFLTIDNPCTGVYVIILVITDYHTQYVKAVVTPTQMAKASTTAF